MKATIHCLHVIMMCFPFVLAVPAQAQGGLAFRNVPMTQFDDQDRKLLKEATLEVLNSPDSKVSKSWENSATGHHGVVSLVSSYHSPDGRECRRLQFDNFAEGLTGSSKFNICRAPGNAWRLDS
jgi:surface antigen